MTRSLGALLVLALVSSACSSPEEAMAHPRGATDVVVEITTYGGLPPPPEILENTLPSFVLYGDGTVIRSAGGGVLPQMEVGELDEDGIQAILAAASDAGLIDSDRVLKADDLFDASTTYLHVSAKGEERHTSVYGLGYGTPVGDDVAAIEGFVAELSELEQLTGEDPGFGPYVPTAVAVAATPVTGEEPTANWDFGNLAGMSGGMEVYGTEWRCDVFADPAVSGALADAEFGTRWRSGSAVFALFARPILPNESTLQGCEPWEAPSPSH